MAAMEAAYEYLEKGTRRSGSFIRPFRYFLFSTPKRGQSRDPTAHNHAEHSLVKYTAIG